MTDTDREAMTDEFDVLARWTADAVERLGPEHALPAACQGSGTPAALEWLEERLGLDAGTHLLDVGSGTGGPAEHAARHTGTAVTLVEPMPGACAAGWTLFHRPSVVGGDDALPFVDATFDAAWSLGVLCSLEEQRTHLDHLHRLVVPGGPVGLLVFERTVDELPEQPDGNDFPREHDLLALVAEAGLEVEESRLLDDLPAAPRAWREAADRVDAAIERDHGDDPAYARATAQRATLGRLGRDGLVRGRLLACRRPA